MGRAYLAQGLSTNGVAVGGLASVDLNPKYASVVESSADGAAGAEDVDRVQLGIDVAVQCTDVAKVNAVLDAASGSTTFSGRESGAATWHHVTVAGLVYGGMSMALAKAADGTLSLNGKCGFANPTDDVGDVLSFVGGNATPPTITYPARLFRPNGASFDPDGAGLAIAPKHLDSVNLSLSRQLITAIGDNEIGEAVDGLGWGALSVDMTFTDVSVTAGDDMVSQIMEAARGVLTVALLGRAGGANKTLTINNLLWSGTSKKQGKEHWSFTLTGKAGWNSNEGAGTTYTLNGGTKLFSIA